MTEIGEIPKEWDVKKIRELRQNIYYGITAKATKENTNLRMLRTTDIKNFKFDLNNLPFCQITEKRSDLSKYFLKRNDIIIARAGTVGVSILVEENLNNVLFGSYLIKIIFKQETIDMPFIHYYFQSQLYWNNISNAQGSTIKNINLPFLNSLEIPLPPIPEQQKIAEILSTVDNKLELLGTKRDKLNVLKKGLMNDLLTGKVRVKV
jgi:type I restriction enzyme S subunit